LPDDEIVHRVSAEWVIEDKEGVKRLTSVAFRSSTRGKYPGYSVDLVTWAAAAGVNPKALVTNPDRTASIVFSAAGLRAAGFTVGWEPVVENEYHGEVWGAASRPGERALRDLAGWYVPLPGVLIKT